MKVEFLVLAAAAAIATPSLALADVTKIPAADVEQQLSCDQARAAFAEVGNPSTDPKRILEIMNAVNRCGAQAYNEAQKANGSDVRAIPVAKVEQDGEKRKVLFELVTVSPRDEAGMRQVCGAAGAAAGVVLGNGDPVMTPVLTKAGQYSCGSYVTALMNDSKLLLVAPTLVPGINMTEDVLRRAGVSETDIQHGKAFVEKAATAATNVAVSGAQAGVAVATGGLVTVSKDLKCVRILGKKVCR